MHRQKRKGKNKHFDKKQKLLVGNDTLYLIDICRVYWGGEEADVYGVRVQGGGRHAGNPIPDMSNAYALQAVRGACFCRYKYFRTLSGGPYWA